MGVDIFSGSSPGRHIYTNRCAWSLEIVRERTREIERTRQLFVTIDAAIARGGARREAQALYQAQRRQALAAIIGGCSSTRWCR